MPVVDGGGGIYVFMVFTGCFKIFLCVLKYYDTANKHLNFC
ncbi:hypothetical protein S7335_3132 [Synechococcus sp. PCC 7335]|nr:hypothetical protein S7335_3132 [Synechococcus sp. PCC 7335]